MRIVIVIAQMLCGGAERVVYNLSLALNQSSHNVSLIVLGDVDTVLYPGLNDIQFNKMPHASSESKLKSNLSKIKYIRNQISIINPDIVLSFIDSTNVLTFFATRGLKIPFVASERNNPDKSKMSRVWYYLRRFCYPFIDSLVVANEGLKKHCHMKKFNKRIDVIPNLMTIMTTDSTENRQNRIIAVGSLTLQKRFDLLLSAIAQLRVEQRLQDYKLVIFGEGPLKETLQKQITDSKLENVVELRGQSFDLMREYKASRIFVLCSDYEGQPNVLLEAMGCGLACIATNCNFGPAEIISNDANGLLIPLNDINALRNAIDCLIHDVSLRTEFVNNACTLIKDEFSQDVIVNKWISLFEQLKYKNERQHTALQ